MYKSDFCYLSPPHNSPFFLAHYSPKAGNSGKAIILVPPFAEELNRSKRMYVLCAQQLAAVGMDVFCFDFVGTGDSYGEWGSFSWSDWQQNLADVYQHVKASGINEISVITLRLGALIVSESVAVGQLQFKKCLFWDPVEDGEVYIRQLVRLKIAAAMSEDAQTLTTKEVMADIENHGFLEVGGYKVAANLLDAVRQAKIAKNIDTLINATQLHWMVLKNAGQSNAVTYPPSIPEALHSQVNMHTIKDTRFWMQQEVTIAPVLLDKTAELFAHSE